jgi:hypothetical protein
MEKSAPRFRCLPEPSGTWMVWDDMTGAPASLGGCALEGRNEDRARAACEILKRIYQNRLDAFSIGKMPRRHADAGADHALHRRTLIELGV